MFANPKAQSYTHGRSTPRETPSSTAAKSHSRLAFTHAPCSSTLHAAEHAAPQRKQRLHTSSAHRASRPFSFMRETAQSVPSAPVSHTINHFDQPISFFDDPPCIPTAHCLCSVCEHSSPLPDFFPRTGPYSRRTFCERHNATIHDGEYLDGSGRLLMVLVDIDGICPLFRADMARYEEEREELEIITGVQNDEYQTIRSLCGQLPHPL